MYDNVMTIEFKKMEQIQEFVSAASKCDFDIDIKCNRSFIDAKSFLGVMAIGLCNKIKVCYAGHNERFQNVVDKLSIA